jgi:DNA-binding transcriptional MocR family regulator
MRTANTTRNETGESKHHNVIALNSFSKIVAPGLRLGWLQASEPLLQHMEDCAFPSSSFLACVRA